MLEQVSSADVCRACGTALDQSQPPYDRLCERCRAQQAFPAQTANDPAIAASDAYPQYQPGAVAQQESPLDPDRPWWGVLTAMGVWLFSLVAIIFVPAIAVVAWIFIDRARGIELQPVTSEADLPPRLLLVGIYSTLAAHFISLGFSWAVVTRLRTQPFLKSLGWHWAGRSALYWALASVGIIAFVFAADQVFVRVLPERETSFDRLLKASQQVRIAVVILATLSAPFVEEVIYRGVLYAGLRKRLSVVASVVMVTMLFAGVHVPQYWGAWASLAGLTLLSLILTVVRAKTKSILPCVVIHFVNNAFFSVFILLNKV
ncbi:MAG TPA: type II CAAX endopeptidase family protein [Blastocatellia bacterium]|nr:type II CAAX endopeptidase family protein [Blastocatellia bacterium]